MLVQAPHAAITVKGCALAARYRRIMRHRGHKKAIVAIAHAQLVIAYHILKHQVPYRELGADYYDRQSRERTRRRAVAALERLGYHVALERVA
jgi:transposase